MSYFDNSVFCSPEITLLMLSLNKIVENHGPTYLKTISKEDSEMIVKDHIVKLVSQITHDCSGEGHWKDEKDFILSKAHCWLFLCWMNTVLGPKKDPEIPISLNTTFYLEVVKALKFEKYMVQCLCQIDALQMDLVRHVAHCIGEFPSNEDQDFLLEMANCCLEDICKVSTDYATVTLIQLLMEITEKCVKNRVLQVKILGTIAQKVSVFSESIHKEKKSIGLECSLPLGLLTEKQNVVQFENKMKRFLSDKLTANDGCQLTTQTETIQAPESCDPVEYATSSLKFFVCCIYCLVRDDWKEFFSWESQDSGHPRINSSQRSDFHEAFVDIYCFCVSLQKHIKHTEADVKKLQGLLWMLHPYIQCQASENEKKSIKEILNKQEVDKEKVETRSPDPGFVDNDNKFVDEKLEEAIFRIEENLFGNEKSFQWLLLTEELYQDERWLKCLVENAEKYVSISTAKLLLDVLCVLRETALPDTYQENIYNSVQQVILETMVSSLSLLELGEVVVYNFDLICLNLDSYTEQSLFILPHNNLMRNWITEMLTEVMNKIVNKTGESFSNEVLFGIATGSLVAPYLTIKTLLSEAVKNTGYEKVTGELLRTMPWFARIHPSNRDPILLTALTEILTTLTSKKQQGQFLKLVATLLRPVIHPVLGSKEPVLLAASDVLNIIIQPLLTNEENNSVPPTLFLNILMTTMACSQPSSSQEHWIIDEKPLEIMFTLFELYHDCLHFWDDWVAEESGDEPMERDDFALDEAWTELNVIARILDEHLIPVLTEAILKEPTRYMNHSSWVETQLKDLDWRVSLLMLPLLQQSMVNCTIKLPKSLVHLITTNHLKAVPLDDDTALCKKWSVHHHVCIVFSPNQLIESVESFWILYFKSCALSNEVCGMFLSHLKDSPPQGPDHGSNYEEIIEALTKVLPFSSWLQWERVLNITREILQLNDLKLNEQSWTADLIDLPESHTATCSEFMINISGLLVSVLCCMSKKRWTTFYVWSTTLKNYVCEVKQLSLTVGEQDNFQVMCHLLAHLTYITFKVIPESFQENIIIVILDVLNAYLSIIQPEDKIFDHTKYLRSILSMIPQENLRLTITNRIKKVVTNITE